MNIENIATAAVDTSISKTELLSAFISRGDKEPSYDGNIYIHEDSKKNKNNLRKVPTQVKGKLVHGQAPETITYPVAIVDLKAYQQNGGSMYFVVYIDKETGSALQIYYSALLPFKIMQLLKDCKNTTSLSIQFTRFPDDNIEKTALFVEFFENAKLQASFAGRQLPPLEDLQKRGGLEGLTIKYGGFRYSKEHPSIPKVTNGKEMFIYANVKDIPSPIPVEYHPTVSHIVMSRELNYPVIVGDRLFFSSYQVVTQEDLSIIKVENCLTIAFPNPDNTDKSNENGRVKITVSAGGTLNQRIKSLPFIDALIKEEALTLGSVRLPVHFEKEKLEKIHYSEFDTQISTYQKIRRVLDQLHVTKDLDLDKCGDMDLWRLNALVGAVDEGATVYHVKEDLWFVSSVNIANIRVAMLCEKTEDGGYKMRDFFSNHIDIVLGYEDEEPRVPHPVSQYSVLKKDDFLRLDNIVYRTIIDDFKSIQNADELNADQANRMMLEMLKAYDENSNGDLLNAAEEINDWLLISPENSAKEIALINKMQIILRRRPLSFQDKQEISALINTSDDPTIKAGAFIILGETEEADKMLSSVDEKIRNEFKEYPLYHLYKPQEDTNNG